VKKYNQFHDGSLEGFWTDGDLVHVYLATEGKERFTMVSQGVEALSANGFREGHIILDVQSRTHEELNLEDMGLLYDLQLGDAGQRQANQLLEQANRQNLIMLEIYPSYGATCLILARSFELMNRKAWLDRYLLAR
jgi:hypothetical protein